MSQDPIAADVAGTVAAGTVAPDPIADAPTPRWPTGHRIADCVRWLAAVALVLLIAGAYFWGARPASLADLETGVSDGQVTRVEVSPGLPADATGMTTQYLQWKEGWRHYRATVRVTTPDPDDSSTSVSYSDDATETWTGRDIATLLRSIDPQVEIVRTGYGGSGATLHGWAVPAWMAWVGIAVSFGALALVVAGPQPWRATRWAWFWLLANPVGLVLFLVLSGPTPPLPDGSRSRRLTGGWAFLLAIPLSSMVAAIG